MGKINDWRSPTLTEAVKIWTGWGREFKPCRDDSILMNHFGDKIASELLSIVKFLAVEYDASEAKYTAPNLVEMGRLASEDFRRKYPEIPDEIVQALEWCYTFDYK